MNFVIGMAILACLLIAVCEVVGGRICQMDAENAEEEKTNIIYQR